MDDDITGDDDANDLDRGRDEGPGARPRPGNHLADLDLARWGFDPGAVVVVTGGASGIGAATALRCAQLGLGVAVWDLQAEAASRVAEQATALGGRALARQVDVGDPASVADAFDSVSERLGAPAHLINNAGPPAAAPIAYADALVAAAGSMQLVCEAFLERELPAGASVVFVASVGGAIVGVDPAWYGSAKAAIVGYMRSRAIQVGRRARLNAVAPSLVDTPRMTPWTRSELGQQWARANPLGRWASADDVARVILFLASPAAGYVNGALVPVDGGQTLVL